MAYLDRQIISLLVEPLRKDLAISDVQISYLQGAAFVLFYTICGLPIGYLVDRLPRRAIICAGILWWSLCSAAGGFADTYTELLIARFGVGAGEAALLPAAYSMIGDTFERHRLSRAMAVFSTGAIFGSALALSVGGMIAEYAVNAQEVVLPVIGAVRSWQFVFIITGFLGIPAALSILLIREPPRLHRKAEAGSGPSENDRRHFVVHWRFYACHIAGFSLFGMLMSGATVWQPAFLQRTFDWPIGKVGFVLGSIHLAAGLIGMLGMGAIADYLQRRGYADAHLRMYIVGLPLLLIAGLASFASGNIWLTLAGLSVISALAPFIAIAASALTLATPPNRRGFTSAGFLFVYNIVGAGTGPTIVAWIAEHLGGAKGSMGTALAAMFVLVLPVVLVLFLLGMAPMRRAVAEVQALAPAAADEPHA